MRVTEWFERYEQDQGQSFPADLSEGLDRADDRHGGGGTFRAECGQLSWPARGTRSGG